MDNVDFWKRLGIRLLRLFGVACTFVGYVIVVELLVFRFRDPKNMQLGFGLIGLGVPHVLAANQLQKNVNFAQEDYVSFSRLLATSSILPAVVLFLVLALHGRFAPQSHVLRLLIATIAVYSFGTLIIFLRRGNEPTPWDRTYIRWGWPVLLAIGIPIAMLMDR